MAPVALDVAHKLEETFQPSVLTAKAKLPSLTESYKTLPAQWMRDESIFELEKRAIFSKVWLLTSHTCHFSKPGDYISGNYVFSYFIIRDRDDNYQAFHNFDEVEGFDKAANGLFKIHTHVTPQGFIFLNFDASPNPVPFEEHFAQLPAEWKDTDFSEYEPYYNRQALGNFNWKVMTDGYQECYHCPIAHPGFADSLDLKNYQVEPLTNSARHSAPKKSNPEEMQRFTFVFPTNGVTVTPEMWYIMRTVPLSATTTRMEFDVRAIITVFSRKGVSQDVLLENREFFTQVQKEDFDLCEGVQRGLNAGVYSTGVLHPKEENGVLYYQSRVLHYCESHLEAERRTGKEIHPSRPSQEASSDSCSASRICSELDEGKGTLAW
ncbi:hypothetical protein EW145_g4449 [Phellinidium pouzarii]|uniref:Choline monooxygenase, chloroplastic n=1 Tax=Phellinidium pouzarii TaxID=167371 RepID=A0A4S4L4W6_9AGAM|nr:hypothetical protein EW145_g4449 [Phellinidium pouzarii]